MGLYCPHCSSASRIFHTMRSSGNRRRVGPVESAMIREKGFQLMVFLLLSFHCSMLQNCDAQTFSNGNDTEALMAFKAEADPGGTLTALWKSNTNPCGDRGTGVEPWVGIQCNSRGRVFLVAVDNMRLSGTIGENTLGRLDQLRYLSIAHNNFTGSLPDDLSNLTRLVQLWAQNAHFSGQFPKFLTTGKRPRIMVINLSGNNFSGTIPDMSGVPSLVSLNLSSNFFTGSIPALPSKLFDLDLGSNLLTGSVPSFLPATLQNLSLSLNKLSGVIPSNLAQKFPSSSFAGNDGLCGLPLSNPCPSPSPSPSPVPSPAPAAVNSNQSSTPPSNSSGNYAPSMSPSSPYAAGRRSSKKLSTRTIVIIVVADTLVLLLVAAAVLTYFRRRYWKEPHTKLLSSGKKRKQRDGAQSRGGTPEADGSKLVFFDEETACNFDLDILLRASAEMLGKGSFGTTYRAVLESGLIVTVKRLKDVKDMGKVKFEQQMELIGSLSHPNLVPLRAYYYAKDENLLVSDFMVGGSLFSLLHGSGSERKSMDWNARLQVAHGVAAGLTYLHQESPTAPIAHGNVKASNVLIGKDFEVCIADFGIVSLMTPAKAAPRMAGYRAPEYNHTSNISQKADVYSFGVLLLELLTGRQPLQSSQGDSVDLPKWVQSMVREEWTGEVFDLDLKSSPDEDEMVALLQIGMACVASNPDQRPVMAQVFKNIEKIRLEEDQEERFEDPQSSMSEVGE